MAQPTFITSDWREQPYGSHGIDGCHISGQVVCWWVTLRNWRRSLSQAPTISQCQTLCPCIFLLMMPFYWNPMTKVGFLENLSGNVKGNWHIFCKIVKSRSQMYSSETWSSGWSFMLQIVHICCKQITWLVYWWNRQMIFSGILNLVKPEYGQLFPPGGTWVNTIVT